jgi:hypothetical protein
MPFDNETALPPPTSTTYPYVHLFSFGDKAILVKQATGQDRTPSSEWKERPVGLNYRVALLTFVPQLSNHTKNPPQILKWIPRSNPTLITPRPMTDLIENP